MFSVGLLYSSRDFLRLNSEAGMSPEVFRKYFNSFKYSTAERILEVSLKCGWSKLTQEGNLHITERGKEISGQDYKSALFCQLEDLIINYNPSWGSILPKGRTEAKNFLPTEVLQCFKEAGLMDELNDNIIGFWDRLSLAYRNFTQKRMTEIGRTGERLSFNFELERTGKLPIWQAIESNLSGFDILSICESNNTQKLQIEVKSSTANFEYAKLHISKHEWNTAKASRNYLFHLWTINNDSKLYIVTVEKMSEHVPIDFGLGEWESVEIPFRVCIQS